MFLGVEIRPAAMSIPQQWSSAAVMMQGLEFVAFSYRKWGRRKKMMSSWGQVSGFSFYLMRGLSKPAKLASKQESSLEPLIHRALDKGLTNEYWARFFLACAEDSSLCAKPHYDLADHKISIWKTATVCCLLFLTNENGLGQITSLHSDALPI